MSGPFRDQELQCPACASTLRPFQDRLCCDECSGMFVDFADLTRSITEMTQVVSALAFTGDAPGPRKCPRCILPMTRAQIEVLLDTKLVKPKLELDRCVQHGVWFDDLELAKLLEAVHGGVSRHSYGAGKPMKIGKKKI